MAPKGLGDNGGRRQRAKLRVAKLRGTGLSARMSTPDTLSMYLQEGALERAKAGKNPLASRFATIAKQRGLRFATRPIDAEQRLRALARNEFAVCQMVAPFAKNMLVIRPAYLPAFWRIEDTAERWQFEVAQRSFDPDSISARNARAYVKDLRKRRFGARVPAPKRDGYVFVPLQGKLSLKRSFQQASPLDMLVQVLAKSGGRRVVATLHPRETMTDWEKGALSRIAAQNPRLTVAEGPAEKWLPGCDYVVTQNSGAAFEGFFWHKPAVLFGRSDFHHICANVSALGVDGAFARAEEMLAEPPDFDRYLTWFIRDNCVNPANAYSPRRIVQTLARRGWTLPKTR